MGIHFLEAFRSNLDLLCRHTVISEELVVGLISKGLVSEFYSNFLDACKGNFEKAAAVYSHISTKWSEENFSTFIDILLQTNNLKSVDILKNAGVSWANKRIHEAVLREGELFTEHQDSLEKGSTSLQSDVSHRQQDNFTSSSAKDQLKTMCSLKSEGEEEEEEEKEEGEEEEEEEEENEEDMFKKLAQHNQHLVRKTRKLVLAEKSINAESFVTKLTSVLNKSQNHMKTNDLISSAACFFEETEDFVHLKTFSTVWHILVFVDSGSLLFDWLKNNATEFCRELLFHPKTIKDCTVYLLLKHQAEFDEMVTHQELCDILSNSPYVLCCMFEFKMNPDQGFDYLQNYTSCQDLKELVFQPCIYLPNEGTLFDVVIRNTERPDINLWCLFISDLFTEEELHDKLCGPFRVSDALIDFPCLLKRRFGEKFTAEPNEIFVSKTGNLVTTADRKYEEGSQEELTSFNFISDLQSFVKLAYPSDLISINRKSQTEQSAIKDAVWSSSKEVQEFFVRRSWLGLFHTVHSDPEMLQQNGIQTSDAQQSIAIHTCNLPVPSPPKLGSRNPNTIRRSCGKILLELELIQKYFDKTISRPTLSSMCCAFRSEGYNVHCVGYSDSLMGVLLSSIADSGLYIGFASYDSECILQQVKSSGALFIDWIVNNILLGMDIYPRFEQIALTGSNAAAKVAEFCCTLQYSHKEFSNENFKAVSFWIKSDSPSEESSKRMFTTFHNTKFLSEENVINMEHPGIIESYLLSMQQNEQYDAAKKMLIRAVSKGKAITVKTLLDLLVKNHGRGNVLKLLLMPNENLASVWEQVISNTQKDAHFSDIMLLILENIGLGIKSHPEMFIDKSNQIIKPWIMYVLSDTLLEPILSDLGLFKAFLEVVHQLTEIVREEKFNVSELLGRIVRSIFRYHCRKTEQRQVCSLEENSRVMRLLLDLECFEETGTWNTTPFLTMWMSKTNFEDSTTLTIEECTLHKLLHPEIRISIEKRIDFLHMMREVYPQGIYMCLLISPLLIVPKQHYLYGHNPLQLLELWRPCEQYDKIRRALLTGFEMLIEKSDKQNLILSALLHILLKDYSPFLRYASSNTSSVPFKVSLRNMQCVSRELEKEALMAYLTNKETRQFDVTGTRSRLVKLVFGTDFLPKSCKFTKDNLRFPESGLLEQNIEEVFEEFEKLHTYEEVINRNYHSFQCIQGLENLVFGTFPLCNCLEPSKQIRQECLKRMGRLNPLLLKHLSKLSWRDMSNVIRLFQMNPPGISSYFKFPSTMMPQCINNSQVFEDAVRCLILAAKLKETDKYSRSEAWALYNLVCGHIAKVSKSKEYRLLINELLEASPSELNNLFVNEVEPIEIKTELVLVPEIPVWEIVILHLTKSISRSTVKEIFHSEAVLSEIISGIIKSTRCCNLSRVLEGLRVFVDDSNIICKVMFTNCVLNSVEQATKVTGELYVDGNAGEARLCKLQRVIEFCSEVFLQNENEYKILDWVKSKYIKSDSTFESTLFLQIPNEILLAFSKLRENKENKFQNILEQLKVWKKESIPAEITPEFIAEILCVRGVGYWKETEWAQFFSAGSETMIKSPSQFSSVPERCYNDRFSPLLRECIKRFGREFTKACVEKEVYGAGESKTNLWEFAIEEIEDGELLHVAIELGSFEGVKKLSFAGTLNYKNSSGISAKELAELELGVGELDIWGPQDEIFTYITQAEKSIRLLRPQTRD